MKQQVMILEDGSEINLIHYVHKVRNVNKIACVPTLPEADMCLGKKWYVWQRSDDPRAVSCPMCKATQEYQETVTFMKSVLGEYGRFDG